MNYNTLLNELATMQGVVIGSPKWVDAGLHLNSHQTGGHGAYGWNHLHRVTSQSFVSAVASNYLARPVFDMVRDRSNGYYKGGRAEDWDYGDDGLIDIDHPDGRRIYQTQIGRKLVSGIDLQHADFGPLWAVIAGGQGYTIETGLAGSHPADRVAMIVAQLLVKMVAGQMRTLHPSYVHGRSLFRVLETFGQAHRHDALPWDADNDVLDFLSWLDQYGLPALERAPGLGEIKSKGNHPTLGGPYANIYQSISWMLPAVHYLAEAFEHAHLEDPRDFTGRFAAARVRLSQYLVDIETIAGGAAKHASIIITEKMRKGDANGNALPTLVGAVDASEIGGNPWYRDWAICATHVAAKTLNTPEAEGLRDRVVARSTKAPKVWRVDENREYI